MHSLVDEHMVIFWSRRTSARLATDHPGLIDGGCHHGYAPCKNLRKGHMVDPMAELTSSRGHDSGGWRPTVYAGLSSWDKRICFGLAVLGWAFFIAALLTFRPQPVAVIANPIAALPTLADVEFPIAPRRKPILDTAPHRRPKRPASAMPRHQDAKPRLRGSENSVRDWDATQLPLPLPSAAPTAMAVRSAVPSIVDGKSGQGAPGDRDAGDGRGDGQDDSAVAYARPIWIERPPQDDVPGLWRTVLSPRITLVVVLLECRILPNYKPRHCHILSVSPHMFGFGPASVEMVERSRIRPVLKDGSVSDLPVLVTMSFPRPPAEPSR